MIVNLFKIVEKLADKIDKTFHKTREPITSAVSKFLIKLHINQSHVTATRFVILIAFFPLWIKEQYYLAALCVAINILLDIIDGDLARVLNNDSDLRKFEDVTVDNIAVIIYPLALIWQGLVSGFLGAYYIFIMTLSWWLSALRRNATQKSTWLFRAQASSFLFFTRFCVVTCLMFLYAFFQVEVFSEAIFILSILLTVTTAYDYFRIIQIKT